MTTIPTVQIVHPDDPTVMMTINAGDLLPAHRLWPEQAEGSAGVVGFKTDYPVQTPTTFADMPLRVVKGPRGRWYVKRGVEAVAGPFETEAQAYEAAAAA